METIDWNVVRVNTNNLHFKICANHHQISGKTTLEKYIHKQVIWVISLRKGGSVIALIKKTYLKMHKIMPRKLEIYQINQWVSL